MLSSLKECNLKLSVEKCFFMQKIVKCLVHIVSEFGTETYPVKSLGHIVRMAGIGPDPDKIEKVKISSQPSTHRIEFCPSPITHIYIKTNHQ